MRPHSLSEINRLTPEEKTNIYSRFIPKVLLERFSLKTNFLDAEGRLLLDLKCEAGSTDVKLDLRHVYTAPDPLLFAHLTDTVHDQIHVLLYIVNDPESSRYDVDRMPDGSPTDFGVSRRNIPMEIAAMEAGLAPGQVRRGLRILKHSIASFEAFITSISHEMYFIEPLAYHNAIVFERYGFNYQQGKRIMDRIHVGFQEDGDLYRLMDDSSPFRRSTMHASILGRSWAIHDGILGHPFQEVTMYKRVGQYAGVNTFPNSVWKPENSCA